MMGEKARLLLKERETLEEYLPGLDETLSGAPLLELERPGNGGIEAFREAGGAALLIPREYSGSGASPLEAMRVQCALGSRSPSLAIATTMHHFSVATLVEIASGEARLEGLLLEAIAQQRLLVASGFAEGKSSGGILAPTMRARRTADGYVVNGSKKPCSLSNSMDLLTASASLPEDPDNEAGFAVLMIPATSPGLQRRPFWGNQILAGAESDEVTLREVAVPDNLVFRVDDPSKLDPMQSRGFFWFELLITASYVGVAGALVERVIETRRGLPAERTLLVSELEGALAALEGLVWMTDHPSDEGLARMLFVRYGVQRALERASTQAMELLGGMSFVNSFETSYLFAATRGLAFHPPSRSGVSQALIDYLEGEPLALQ